MKSRTSLPKITSVDDVMTFGKYKGQTIEKILDENPGYIVWLEEKKICEVEHEIYNQAQMLESESRDLRNGDFWGIDYYDFMDETF